MVMNNEPPASCLIHPVVMGNKEPYWSGLTARALCRRYIYYLRMSVVSYSDRNSHSGQFLPGPRAKLPGYVPGADPGVTTPPLVCLIQFVVC